MWRVIQQHTRNALWFFHCDSVYANALQYVHCLSHVCNTAFLKLESVFVYRQNRVKGCNLEGPSWNRRWWKLPEFPNQYFFRVPSFRKSPIYFGPCNHTQLGDWLDARVIVVQFPVWAWDFCFLGPPDRIWDPPPSYLTLGIQSFLLGVLSWPSISIRCRGYPPNPHTILFH
jgi:hypothetical protein